MQGFHQKMKPGMDKLNEEMRRFAIEAAMGARKNALDARAGGGSALHLGAVAAILMSALPTSLSSASESG